MTKQRMLFNRDQWTKSRTAKSMENTKILRIKKTHSRHMTMRIMIIAMMIISKKVTRSSFYSSYQWPSEIHIQHGLALGEKIQQAVITDFSFSSCQNCWVHSLSLVSIYSFSILPLITLNLHLTWEHRSVTIAYHLFL